MASAALVSNVPFSPSGIASAGRDRSRSPSKAGPPPTASPRRRVDVTAASAGYFETMRQPLVAGRRVRLDRQP